MVSGDEQLRQLNAELENLQKGFTYKVDWQKELLGFIIETKAHQFAMTNLVGTILAKLDNSTLHDVKHRYEVFKKGKQIEILKQWLQKYGHLSGPTPSSSN